MLWYILNFDSEFIDTLEISLAAPKPLMLRLRSIHQTKKQNYLSKHLITEYPIDTATHKNFDSKRGREMRICVTTLGHHWIIVNWTIATIFQWNLTQNTMIFIKENECENIVCEMAAILSRPQCVNPSLGKQPLKFNGSSAKLTWTSSIK